MKRKILLCVKGLNPIRTWLLRRDIKKWFGKHTSDQIQDMFRKFAVKEGYTLSMVNGEEVYSRQDGSTISISDSNKTKGEQL